MGGEYGVGFAHASFIYLYIIIYIIIYIYPTHQFSICKGDAACASIVGVQCAMCR